MLPAQKLNQLVKAIEALNGRESDSMSPRRIKSSIPSKEEAEPIVSYLLDPYGNGYWELYATWNPTSHFSTYILDSLNTLDEVEDEPEAPRFLPNSTARKLSSETRDEIIKVTNRLSHIHKLFWILVETKDGKETPSLSNTYSWIKNIDQTMAREKFKEALEIFEREIYFDDFTSTINTSFLYRLKSGLVSLQEGPKTNGILRIVGTRRSDICALSDFYTAVGCINHPTIKRIFSPDEALFRPYFSLVSNVLPNLIQDGQISNVFSQSLDYYKEEDYQHCISTLGLITEDYLQRIYVSLMREQIAGGLTLGQTLDRIHKRIDDLLPMTKPSHKNIDPIYEKIKSIESSSTHEPTKQVLLELLNTIKEDRQYFGKKIDEITKPSTRRTPFPAKINENLNELLKWRNAASHNSRIPLGAHEADRTLYCLVSIITWWQEQIDNIDWSKSKIEIIEILLQAAKRNPEAGTRK